MSESSPTTPPALPLLLWRTPPGLAQILMQEGIPHRVLPRLNPRELSGGRFLLFDRRVTRSRKIRESLTPAHVALDVDGVRGGPDHGRPFVALVDDHASRMTWTVAGCDLTERVSRRDKAGIRRKVMQLLRGAVERRGGVWARLAAFPNPYRSAFNFRADLDEHAPEDYLRFAKARGPIDDCSTAFASTAAYAECPRVLADLKRIDTQSHGHFHHIYRSEAANRRNLARADVLLRRSGFEPTGFAAPGGRWNPGLDRAMADLGYEYSSDFHLGYDDLPFFPLRDGRPSPVLQVPVHPICEGLFLDAGRDDPRLIADHLIATVRAKAAAGAPAFVYGHPERRLGRFPEVISRLAVAVSEIEDLWRVTLTEFARWWRFRASRRWSLELEKGGSATIQFEDWNSLYPLRLEVFRGDRVASVPLTGPRRTFDLDALDFESIPRPADLPRGRPAPRERGLRSALRSVIDWETVTPIDELPEIALSERLKKRLRRYRDAESGQ